jgi:hypothetical protein
MFPPTPPPHPDEHLMQEENRREALERDDKSGQAWQRQKSLSKGDKVIFLVLGAVLLSVVLLLLFAVLAS